MTKNFSKRGWILLWICLILINVIMRIPITSHEMGHDSFLMHFIANSLSISGHAKWWLHPLSMVGLYPFSMASALPFYLSGISQFTHLAMEQAIWIALVPIGILSSFTAYLMAGAIKNDRFFKFITALTYSTSSGILLYTTWNASGRGLILVLLPLFIYFLIKYRFYKLKYTLFTIILFLLLMATHNLFFLTIPILLSFVIALLIRNIQIKSSIFLGAFLFLTLFIFFFMEFSVEKSTLVEIIINYARYIGILGIFILGGFISILVKPNKTFEESFIILMLLVFTPFLGVEIYAKFFMLPLEALLVGYGIVNLVRISQKRTVALNILMVIILISIGVGEYYQFGRTNLEEKSLNSFWAEDSTIEVSLWTKYYINKTIYIEDRMLSRRILAYSGANMLSESDIVHIIQNNTISFDVEKRSPLSTLFYSQGPFHAENQTGMRNWAWQKLKDEGLNSRWGYLVRDLGIKYYVRNEAMDSIFSRSILNTESQKLFDNGKSSIWGISV